MNYGRKMVERKGIEPSTFALRTRPHYVGSMGYAQLADRKGPFRAVAAHRCCTPNQTNQGDRP
jgi:hypothetical protein